MKAWFVLLLLLPLCMACISHTKCSLESSKLVLTGGFKPQCDEEGSYHPVQCHGSTGYCWCVDKNGEKIGNTRVGPGSDRPQCEEASTKHTKCSLESSKIVLIGGFKPRCDEEGSYHPVQCHGSTGHCWCVDKNGEEIGNTRVGPGSDRPQCEAYANHTKCSLESSKLVLIGGFKPQCDEEGSYHPMQCHGSTGYCWCVDKNGTEIANTSVGPGSDPPQCAGASTNQTKCSLESSKIVLPGGFKPRCDEEGSYHPMQCHGSTGHCWCVDKNGMEYRNTRVGPGSDPPQCGRAEHRIECYGEDFLMVRNQLLQCSSKVRQACYTRSTGEKGCARLEFCKRLGWDCCHEDHCNA